MARKRREKQALSSLISQFVQRVTKLPRELIKPVEALRWHFRVSQFLIRSIGGDIGKDKVTFFRSLSKKYASYLADLVDQATMEATTKRRIFFWLNRHDGVRPLRRDDLVALLKVVFDTYTKLYRDAHVTLDGEKDSMEMRRSEVVDVLYHHGVLPDRVVELLPQSFVSFPTQEKLAV